MDFVDNILFELTFFEDLTLNCLPRDNTTVGAQWLRLAYHDMATHNFEDGTGGMDGSILYEFDRAANVGLNRTIEDFVGFGTRFFGLADLIAAGVVVGTLECGGPLIPFRAGRIDALGAGNVGTPEPFHDLETIQESFRKQGLTQSEMIALTACGHALGGVTRGDFPEVVKEGEFMPFNKKTTKFNNDVVTQYLDGSTPNPLVIGINATMNSDIRVFAADGNVTMQSLSSPEVFNQTCIDLLERMINTVPSSVTLTEVIEPWDYKVGEARLAVSNTSDTLVMTTTLRLLNVKENPDRQIKLVWGRPERQGHGKTGITYSFSLSDIDPIKSIGKFWFEIDEQDGSDVTFVENDDGGGYVIPQDDVLYDITRSTLFANEDASNFTAEIVVAVKNELVGKAPINIETAESFTLPYTFRLVEAKEDTRFPKTAGYTFFSAKTPEFLTTGFDLYYGDITNRENLKVEFALLFEALNTVPL